MTSKLSRRTFLGAAAASTVAPAVPAWLTEALAADGLTLGEGRPFSFAALVEEAKARAGRDYVEPYRPAPELVAKIDYEVHGALRYKPSRALYAEGKGVYPVTFFHLGQFFQKAVKMHVLDGGQAREIVYSPDYFAMPADSIARRMPPDSGFAGFRLQESRNREDWQTQDWVAFLGAAYFRAIGALNQYGLSARGVTVDVAAPTPEEFPDFVEFYIGGAERESEANLIYALLDGPSISGAFAFAIRRTDGVVMDIDARLFARRPIYRLGLAPLTSMFWYAEYNRGRMIDWRPEVHDSDGLAMWTGTGERIWRALNNPDRVVTSSFADKAPKGFGLLQRDRNVENYLDGVNYDRRPSLWVEPLGDWGEGTIQLVEIPTDDEIHDNIVAFWVPKAPVEAGAEFAIRYRLHWQDDEPYPASQLGYTVATRMGRGGEPGKPRPEGVRKFVVDFQGGPLDGLTSEAAPTPDISASRGTISYAFVEPVPRTQRWRAQFDLTSEGADPVEIRLFLRQGDRPLTETWMFQYWPVRST